MKHPIRFIPIVLVSLVASPFAAQQSSALYDTPLVVLGSKDPQFNRVLDFDGDGKLDALGMRVRSDATGYYRQLRLYRNTGDGTFAPTWSAELPASAADLSDPIAAGDLNGDQLDDFVVTNASSATVNDDALWVYLSNGLAAPTLAGVVIPAGIANAGIVVTDLTGDGLGDIGLLRSNIVSVYASPSCWLATPSVASFANPYGYVALFAARVDGAGGEDLVVALPTGFSAPEGIQLVPVVGGAPIPSATHIATGIDHGMYTAGDVDGDGDDDVVNFGMLGICRILRQMAPGSFTLESAQSGGPATGLADVDGDGDLDGVCCSSGGGPSDPDNTKISTFEIATNQGDGNFALAFAIEGLGAEHIAGAADLDGDGDADLIAGRVVYYGRGPLVKPPAQKVQGTIPTYISGQLGDHDGDGDPDLLSSPGATYVNDGAGGMSVKPVTLLGLPAATTFISAYTPGDWDGDGDLDTIMGYYKAGPPIQAGDALLRNGGGGAFTWSKDVHPGELTNHFLGSLVFDFDADGDEDWMTTSDYSPILTGPPETHLYWNDGTATFSEGASFSETVKAIGDLDGDAVADLLELSTTQVGWRKNLGGKLFGAFAALSAAVPQLDHAHDALPAADLDGDGDLDLAYLSNKSSVVVLRNDGPGVVTSVAGLVPDLPVYNVAHKLLAADADGDGHADLHLTNADVAGNTTTIWRWTGPGLAFAPGASQILAPDRLGDLDGDGDGDGLNRLSAQLGAHYLAPQNGMRLQSGTGTAGTSGLVPVLGAEGPFRAGETVTVHGTNGRGGSLAYFVWGLSGATLADFPFAGMITYVNVFHPSTIITPFAASGAPGAVGEGSFGFSIGIPAPIAGFDIYHQAFFLDPGSPNGIVSASPRLYIHYGS